MSDVAPMYPSPRGRGLRVSLRPPEPLSPPDVDPELADLPPLLRVAEAMRYQFLAVEYAISPGGFLRAWMKSTVFLAVLIVLPTALLVPPLLGLATGMALIAEQLALALRNLLHALLYLIAVVMLSLFLGAILACFRRDKSQ